MDASQNNNPNGFSGNMMTDNPSGVPIHDGGDIILVGEDKKQKPEKKKILLLLGAVGVVIVLVIALVVMMLGWNNDSVEGRYYKFMNYLIYQDKSTKKIENLNDISLDECALVKNVKEYDANIMPDYMKELSELWNGLSESLEVRDEEDYVKNISDGLDFLTVFSSNHALELEQDRLFDEGKDIAEVVAGYNEIMTRYNGTNSSSSAYYAVLENIYVGELVKMSELRNSESNKRYRANMQNDMISFVVGIAENVIGQSIEISWEIGNE